MADENKVKPTRERILIHWYNDGEKKKMFEMYRLDNSLQCMVKSTGDDGKWNTKSDIVISMSYSKAHLLLSVFEDLMEEYRLLGDKLNKFNSSIRVLNKKGTGVIQCKLATDKEDAGNKAFYINLINDDKKEKVIFSGAEFIEIDTKSTDADGKEKQLTVTGDTVMLQIKDMMEKIKNYIYDAANNAAFDLKMYKVANGGGWNDKKLPGEDDDEMPF